MKKVNVLLGMLVSLAIITGMSSCSRDDDNGIDNNASIVGTWGCVHSTSSYYDVHVGNDTIYKEDAVVGKTIVFKDDGTFTYPNSLGAPGFAYSSGSGGSWMIDGSILYIEGDKLFKWNIRQLTNDKLVIYIKYWTDIFDQIYYEEPEEYVKTFREYLIEFRRQQ